MLNAQRVQASAQVRLLPALVHPVAEHLLRGTDVPSETCHLLRSQKVGSELERRESAVGEAPTLGSVQRAAAGLGTF